MDPIGIDIGALFSGKIIMHKECAATVQMVLTAQDLNNFLQSELVRDQAGVKLRLAGQPICKLQVHTISTKGMAVTAEYMGRQIDLLSLSDENGKPHVVPVRSPREELGGGVADTDQAVAHVVENFLSTLTIDLSGTICNLTSFKSIGNEVHIQAIAKITRFPSRFIVG